MKDIVYFNEGLSNSRIDRSNLDSFIDTLDKNEHLGGSETLFDDFLEDLFEDYSFEWVDDLCDLDAV